jgi:hypothetical protein
MEFVARPINFHGNKGVMAKNSIKIVKAFYAFFTLIMTSCYVRSTRTRIHNQNHAAANSLSHTGR